MLIGGCTRVEVEPLVSNWPHAGWGSEIQVIDYADRGGKPIRWIARLLTDNTSDSVNLVLLIDRVKVAARARGADGTAIVHMGSPMKRAALKDIGEVLVTDNTKAIVHKADPYHPTLNTTFLEYAQARGFHIDTTRVRRPRDKGRVEKSVRDSQDDCFGGESLPTLFDAVAHAERYCKNECGMRRHSTTQRLPHVHFTASEKPCLLPAPVAA